MTAHGMTPQERLMTHVKKTPGGCWLWQGSKDGNGYGTIKVDGSFRVAHEVSWEAKAGRKKKSGMVLDHTCEKRLCVRPGHLQEVTQSENIKRIHTRKLHKASVAEVSVRYEAMRDRVVIEKVDVGFDVPISKIDPEQRIAFGWASVAITKSGEVVIDRQQDMIDSIGELEVAVYDYVENSRDAGEMHLRKGIGALVESIVFTPEKIAALGLPPNSVPQGWWTGYRINDQAVWDGVKDGTYPMLSVHGVAKREVVI